MRGAAIATVLSRYVEAAIVIGWDTQAYGEKCICKGAVQHA